MEVLIAMMIIGLLGVAVVGGLVIVRTTSDRTEAKAEMLRLLSDAATEVSLQPFVACGSGTYTTTSTLNPTVVIEVRNTTTQSWDACDSTKATATIQRVTLSTTWQGKTYSRMLMKAKS